SASAPHEDAAAAALSSGDAAHAASALTSSLSQALNQSGARLTAVNLDGVRADVQRELQPVAALGRNAGHADFAIEWRQSLVPPNSRQTACNGFVELGDAMVTATSSQTVASPGMASLSCALLTQSRDAFGWTGLAVLSVGQGGLYVRFSYASPNAVQREAA